MCIKIGVALFFWVRRLYHTHYCSTYMLSSSILKNMSNICHTLICFLGGAEKHSGKISGVFFFNTYVKNYN